MSMIFPGAFPARLTAPGLPEAVYFTSMKDDPERDLFRPARSPPSILDFMSTFPDMCTMEPAWDCNTSPGWISTFTN